MANGTRRLPIAIKATYTQKYLRAVDNTHSSTCVDKKTHHKSGKVVMKRCTFLKEGTRTHRWLVMNAGGASTAMSGGLTTGEGDRDMLPMEALSSSTVGAATTRSASSGLILILNFFLWPSSSSDSSEEKKGDFLVTGSNVALRKRNPGQHSTMFQTASRLINLSSDTSRQSYSGPGKCWGKYLDT